MKGYEKNHQKYNTNGEIQFHSFCQDSKIIIKRICSQDLRVAKIREKNFPLNNATQITTHRTIPNNKPFSKFNIKTQ